MDLNRKNITDEIDSRLTQNINALFFNTYFKEVYKKIKNKDKLIFVADKHYSNFPFDMMVINNLI